MRKLLLILSVVCFVAVACTDKDYDLSNIEDNFAIGDSESEFLAPLATLTFHAKSFSHHNSNNNKESVIDVYKEADIWLPTTLPGGVDYVEVQRLMSDMAYLDTIVEALITEMENSPAKANSVYNLIAVNHKAEYLAYVKTHAPAEVYAALESASTEQTVSLISQLFEADHGWAVEAIESICAERLNDLTFDNVVYDLPALDLSEDIKDMIVGNIGNKGEANENKLYIAGHVDSGFPFDINVSPRIENTSVEFKNIHLYFNEEVDIPQQQVYKSDVERLFGGAKIVIEFAIERYYPSKVDIAKQEAHIELHLRKTGCLTL